MLAERAVANRIALELAVVFERQSQRYRTLARMLTDSPGDDCAAELAGTFSDHRLAIRLASAMRELYEERVTSPSFPVEPYNDAPLPCIDCHQKRQLDKNGRCSECAK